MTAWIGALLGADWREGPVPAEQREENQRAEQMRHPRAAAARVVGQLRERGRRTTEGLHERARYRARRGASTWV